MPRRRNKRQANRAMYMDLVRDALLETRRIALQMVAWLDKVKERLLLVVRLCEGGVQEIDCEQFHRDLTMAQRFDAIRREFYFAGRRMGDIESQVPVINRLTGMLESRNLEEYFEGLAV